MNEASLCSSLLFVCVEEGVRVLLFQVVQTLGVRKGPQRVLKSALRDWNALQMVTSLYPGVVLRLR